MASDNLSGIGDAIRKASAAYAEALAAVGKALQGLAGGAAGGDRDRLVENWLRVARMSKDGVITALEQGFELWEREIRRTVASVKRRLCRGHYGKGGSYGQGPRSPAADAVRESGSLRPPHRRGGARSGWAGDAEARLRSQSSAGLKERPGPRAKPRRQLRKRSFAYQTYGPDRSGAAADIGVNRKCTRHIAGWRTT